MSRDAVDRMKTAEDSISRYRDCLPVPTMNTSVISMAMNPFEDTVKKILVRENQAQTPGKRIYLIRGEDQCSDLNRA